MAKVYPQVEAVNQNGFATTIKLIDLPGYAQFNLQTIEVECSPEYFTQTLKTILE
ncbi:MAG: hypothetical protein Kow0049_32280 [Stanieria sp.]